MSPEVGAVCGNECDAPTLVGADGPGRQLSEPNLPYKISLL